MARSNIQDPACYFLVRFLLLHIYTLGTLLMKATNLATKLGHYNFSGLPVAVRGAPHQPSP